MLTNTESRPLPESPLVVAYGIGVDSTAVLVGLAARGLRPDLILFADVGAEKPETYAYLPVINEWLRSVGFPEVTVVRYAPLTAPYTTLEGKCEANETLPSLAFGGHSCSLVFKKEPQDKHLFGTMRGKRRVGGWAPALAAEAAGRKVVKAIGYDNGTADGKRAARYCEKGGSEKDTARFEYWYPLRDWAWDREECMRQIAAVGLPVPPKSACFFCPASKKHEIDWLAEKHPELFARAVAMEDRARDGKHGLQGKLGPEGKRGRGTKGLGRNFSWREYGEQRGLIERRVDGRVGLAVVQPMAEAA
jgi:hypothetical protein